MCLIHIERDIMGFKETAFFKILTSGAKQESLRYVIALLFEV